MRHQVFGKKLNKDVKERKSLFKNLVSSLIVYGKITTSVAKAKAIRGLVDKLVNTSKTGTLAARRQVEGFLNRGDVVKKLVDSIAPKLKGRTGGYTRIIRTEDRVGDGSTQAVMEWVDDVKEKPVPPKPSVTKPEAKSSKKEAKK